MPGHPSGVRSEAVPKNFIIIFRLFHKKLVGAALFVGFLRSALTPTCGASLWLGGLKHPV